MLIIFGANPSSQVIPGNLPAACEVTMHCRLWNVEGDGVQSVEHDESGVLRG